jgi:hypothetical protein
VDVLTVPEAGMLGASDAAHLELATRQQRVIFTQDEDFLRLHAQGITHAGIVYASQHTPVGDIIRGLMLIYHVLDPAAMQNHVEFLQADQFDAHAGASSICSAQPVRAGAGAA